MSGGLTPTLSAIAPVAIPLAAGVVGAATPGLARGAQIGLQTADVFAQLAERRRALEEGERFRKLVEAASPGLLKLAGPETGPILQALVSTPAGARAAAPALLTFATEVARNREAEANLQRLREALQPAPAPPAPTEAVTPPAPGAVTLPAPTEAPQAPGAAAGLSLGVTLPASVQEFLDAQQRLDEAAAMAATFPEQQGGRRAAALLKVEQARVDRLGRQAFLDVVKQRAADLRRQGMTPPAAWQTAALEAVRLGLPIPQGFEKFVPQPQRGTVVQREGRLVLVNPETGQTIEDLGRAPRKTVVVQEGGRQILVDTETGQTVQAFGPKPEARTLTERIAELQASPDPRNQEKAAQLIALERDLRAAGAIRLPPTQQIEQVIDTRAFIDTLARVGQLHRPHFTGPVEGRLGAARQATGVGSTPDEAEFRALLAAARNELLRLRSGAAVTEQEFRRLQQELPTENDPDEVFRTKLNTAIATATRILRRRVDTLKEFGFQVPEGMAPTRRTPTRAAIEAARRQAGGDPRRAAKILEAQGFDLDAEVEE